jgi:U3 small nucleolar ribonucleoprotein protein LCP5
MIENRAVLEKIHVLEVKMCYQIDKLIRIAEEPSQDTRLADGKLYLSTIVLHIFLLFFE